VIDHVEGCAVVRTTRCTCAYLAQWDNTTEGQECVKALAEYTPKQRWNWPIVIASGVEDPNEVATKIVRDNPQWFGELPDGTYQTLETDSLQRKLDDEKLRSKYWHKEYLAQRKRWWWAVSFAAVCAATTGTVLAWAGVL
jgi:hypothetical protein